MNWAEPLITFKPLPWQGTLLLQIQKELATLPGSFLFNRYPGT